MRINMTSDSYQKRISGLSVGVVTFLSIASMSPIMLGDGLTISNNNKYMYEGISNLSDNEGMLCVSSALSKQVRGDMLLWEEDAYPAFSQREPIEVQLKVTDVHMHKAVFDFEDDFEEM